MLAEQNADAKTTVKSRDSMQDRAVPGHRPSWRRPVVTRIDVGRATLVCASCNPC